MGSFSRAVSSSICTSTSAAARRSVPCAQHGNNQVATQLAGFEPGSLLYGTCYQLSGTWKKTSPMPPTTHDSHVNHARRAWMDLQLAPCSRRA